MDAEYLLADGIEAVAIITPNNLHAEIAKVFLSKGIHVMCEKPMTTNLEDALELRELANENSCVLAVAHGYSGYSMIHAARDLVADGAIGQVVEVQVEYASSWGAMLSGDTDHKGGVWKTNPLMTGPSISISDLGVHAHHLARLVTGLEITEVSSELSTLVPGRSVDDNAHVMLRFNNGARGLLWSTIAAAGTANNLKLRVFGHDGHLEWTQETPDRLDFRPLAGPVKIYRRSLDETSGSAKRSRRRPGQPEGFVDSFANIYRDFASHIIADKSSKGTFLPRFPDCHDGVAGVAFIEAVAKSSNENSRWISVYDSRFS